MSVVAKVPVKEQRNVYRDTFQNARGEYDEQVDVPVYVGYYVQRAELLPGEDPSQLAEARWQAVPVCDAKGSPNPMELGSAMSAATAASLNELAASEWAQGVTEVVDPRYLDPSGILAYPLPPLVGREWGREATHPDIPLGSGAAEDLTTVAAEAAPAARPERGAKGDQFSLPEQGYALGRRDAGGRAGQRMNFGERDAGGTGAERRDGGRSGMSLQVMSDAYLVRFFDFKVTPGKRYSYRAQLVMADPNLAPHVKFTYLDAQAADRIKKLPKGPDGRPVPASTFLRTDWSQPTSPVSVPLDGTVRMAGVQPADEPRRN